MFISQTPDLLRSVTSFMQAPALWRDAVGNHPKYFVHHVGDHGHEFGLSKYCAFKDIILTQYVDDLRDTTHGSKTRRKIEKVSGSRFVPLTEVNEETRIAFERWFFSFFPRPYDRRKIGILSV